MAQKEEKKPAENCRWTVDHDAEKCALCLVCARNCPTGALRRYEEGEYLSLFYSAALCDGCGGDALCEKNCPEEAIRLAETDAPIESEGFAQLNRSKMVQCAYCEEYFAPARRLDVVAGRAHDKHKKIERELCPLCRRTSLVVEFIEEHRAPGSKAEYRSANDIIRRYKREQKKSDKKD